MSKPNPRQRQINVQVPSDLDAVYSNLAMITHSSSEVIIDFAHILPNVPNARVCARIITPPLHAKLLLRALKENLDKYEAQFGEIKVPDKGDALARQFFGTAKPPRAPES
jgi:hypothetical protein